MNLVFIYITASTKEEADKIATHLLKKKLIACANIFPIENIYRWEEKITKGKEYVLILKTANDKFEEVKEEVENIHSYDTPCIVKIPVEANDKYFNWIKNELK